MGEKDTADLVRTHLKVLDEKPLTVAELRDVLGLEDDEELGPRIPVCAGEWVRRDDGLYGFDKDPEWGED